MTRSLIMTRWHDLWSWWFPRTLSGLGAESHSPSTLSSKVHIAGPPYHLSKPPQINKGNREIIRELGLAGPYVLSLSKTEPYREAYVITLWALKCVNDQNTLIRFISSKLLAEISLGVTSKQVEIVIRIIFVTKWFTTASSFSPWASDSSDTKSTKIFWIGSG
jgi:hypothetical protein